MTWAEAYRARLVLIMVPAIIVTAGFGLRLLPDRLAIDVFNLFTLWLGVSFPISVLIGHSMLSEPEW